MIYLLHYKCEKALIVLNSKVTVDSNNNYCFLTKNYIARQRSQFLIRVWKLTTCHCLTFDMHLVLITYIFILNENELKLL